MFEDLDVFLDNLSFGIAKCDKTGNIIYSNKTFKELTEDKINVFDFIYEEFHENIKDAFNNLKSYEIRSSFNQKAIINEFNYCDVFFKPYNNIFLLEIKLSTEEVIKNELLVENIKNISEINETRKKILEELDIALIDKKKPCIFLNNIMDLLDKLNIFDYAKIICGEKVDEYGDKNKIEKYEMLMDEYEPIIFENAENKEENVEFYYFINKDCCLESKSLFTSTLKFLKLYIAVFNDYNKMKVFEEKMLDSENFNIAGLMMVGMFHEINNPLTIALLQTDLNIRKKVYDSTRLEKTRNALLRIKSITNIFRGALRRESDEKPVDLIEIINTAIILNEGKYEEKIVFDFSYEKTDYIVLSDYNKIIMVFVNLLSNAVDAIIQKKSQEGKVKIELFDFRTNYICKISDNGIGMEQDVVKNIFKPFYTTKSKTGLGYGMFFVSSVCSAHKIKINVTSKKEYGTTFTLVIPKLTQGVD